MLLLAACQAAPEPVAEPGAPTEAAPAEALLRKPQLPRRRLPVNGRADPRS